MITIVTAASGRCGTSLTMQMLQAAGVPLYWDRIPNRTTINPRGHYEVVMNWYFNGRLMRNLLRRAEGKAVKLFWSKLKMLTPMHEYQFIELQRDPYSMYDSQKIMLREEGRVADDRHTIEGIIRGRNALHLWLRDKKHITVQFPDLFNGVGAEQIARFMKFRYGRERNFAIRKMMDACDPTLWHFKPEVQSGSDAVSQSAAVESDPIGGFSYTPLVEDHRR